MNLFCLALIVCVTVCTISTQATSVLPDDVEKCNYEDDKCLTQRIQFVINKYAKTGIRSVNLIPFDPLRIKRLKLARNPDSPVSINLDFQDVDLIGLEAGKIHSVSGFDANAKKTIEVKAFVPKLMLKGQYEVDGRVLILPIVGKGASDIILDDMDIVLKAKAKLITKNDKKYMEITGLQLHITPKKVVYNLEGLFNQNKELGDNMLTFLNENWSDIFKELQPDIQEALGKIFKQILNNVFSKYPYTDYFNESDN